MRIAVGGSATDPLTDGHIAILEYILHCGRYDLVVWIPSGIRGDKNLVASPDHRIGMIMAALPRKWFLDPTRLQVSFHDVYGDNTPSIVWLEQLQQEYPDAEIEWFTGSDSIVPREEFSGKCEIEARWHRGAELLEKWPFFVIERSAYPFQNAKIPLARYTSATRQDVKNVIHYELPDTASSRIKESIKYRDFHGLPEEVARYIRLNQLYGYKL